MGNFFTNNYIKWGFESRLKLFIVNDNQDFYYIKWGFESRLKLYKKIPKQNR